MSVLTKTVLISTEQRKITTKFTETFRNIHGVWVGDVHILFIYYVYRLHQNIAVCVSVFYVRISKFRMLTLFTIKDLAL